jgi:hypothetical protein
MTVGFLLLQSLPRGKRLEGRKEEKFANLTRAILPFSKRSSNSPVSAVLEKKKHTFKSVLLHDVFASPNLFQ